MSVYSRLAEMSFSKQSGTTQGLGGHVLKGITYIPDMCHSVSAVIPCLAC